MARRRKGFPGLSFSWKRATGVSAAKGRLSRKIGVPLTRSGRREKAAKSIGCTLPFLFIVVAIIEMSSYLFAAESNGLIVMPQIDIKSICLSYVQRSRLGPQAVDMCIEDEERAKWRLSTIWPKASPSTLKNCSAADEENIKKSNPYRYTNYADCVAFFIQQEKIRSQYGLPPLPDDYIEQSIKERAR